MADRTDQLAELLRRPLRHVAGWPLRVQLAGAFACVIVLCIGLLQIGNARGALAEELADSHEKQRLLAAKAAWVLDRHMSRAIADFRFLASHADRLDELRDLAGHMAGFGLVAVQVIGRDGTVSTVAPDETGALPALPDADGIAALAAGPPGAVQLSGIERQGGMGFVRIGTRRADGVAVLGVLSVDFAREIQQRVRFGTLGHAAIVDAGGRVITHPDPAYEADRRDLSGLPVVHAALGGGTGAGRFFAPALQAEALAGYAPVPSTGWAVIVPRPVAEFEAQARGRLAGQSLIGALVLGAGLVLSSLLARAVTRPIGRLTQAAHRIAAGDYRHGPAIADGPGGSGEIAVLGAAFDRMRREVDQARESLLTAFESAERESGAKTRFLTMLGHELRTPMNAVLGMLRVLAEDEADPTRRTHVARAEDAARHLNRLLDDILEFNGSDQGCVALRRRAFAPQRLLRDLAASVAREAEAKGVTVRVAADAALPKLLEADPDRLRQVLFAIVGNAVKFTDRGSVRIRATLREDAAGPRLEVRVADTGIGMTEAELGRVFDGFQQADAGYARRRGGLGLGLAISRRVLAAMGGRMTVRSRPGQGSVFVVRVPVSRPAAAPAAAGAEADAGLAPLAAPRAGGG